jgi:hypothetical protein
MGTYALEWRLASGKKFRALLVKFPMILFLVTLFLLIYFPGGLDGYLSYVWRVTVFLDKGVSPKVGSIYAERLERLRFIEKASYIPEEDVWKDFLSFSGGKGKIDKIIKNPLPSYIEVRLRKDHLDGDTLKKLITIVKKESITRDVIYGGDGFHRMVRAKKYLKGFLILLMLLSGGVIFVLFYHVDTIILLSVEGGLRFIGKHGFGRYSSMSGRIGGSIIEGFLSGTIAVGILLSLSYILFESYPIMRHYLSFPDFQDPSPFVIPSIGAALMSSALFCASSIISLEKTMEKLDGERE